MLIFADGCDAYSVDTDILNKWDAGEFGPTLWEYGAGEGMNGGGAIKCHQNDISLYKKIGDIGGSVNHVRVGFWFKAPDTGQDDLMLIGDKETGMFHRITCNAAGSIGFTKADGPGSPITTQYTTIGAFDDDNWHYFELFIQQGTADGVMRLKIDNVVEINQVNINTADNLSPDVVANFSEIRLQASDEGWHLDDFIVWNDLTGSDVGGDFTGELTDPPTIETNFITADGATVNFTPNGAASNFECVDEVGGHDGDTTFVRSSAVGNKDLYVHSPLATTPTTILAAVLNLELKTDEGYSADFVFKMSNNATELTSASETLVSSSIRNMQKAFLTDPDTGAAFTEAGYNATQVGLEIA